MDDFGDGVGKRLYPLWSGELDPLFWPASRAEVESAWITHVPFAHWLVAVHRPRSIIELGTHRGVSYSAFCEAVQRTRLDCRCLAVDTWEGDEHAGFYGGEIYADLRRFHDARYAGFSDLMRCTFDAALAYVPDNSVDLLHIDGLHTYDAVRGDFERWRPKLTDRAVVLFHDTNVREREFGVWRLWAELSSQYPSFEFLHGHGLGVLAVGASCGEEVRALCRLSDFAANAVRERFSLLGDRWHAAMQATLTQAEHATTQAEHATQVQRLDLARHEQAMRAAALEADLAHATHRAGEDRRMRAEAAARAAAARREAIETLGQVARAEQETAEVRAQAQRELARAQDEQRILADALARAEEQARETARQRDMVLESTAWRATWPVRALAERIPGSVRRTARGSAKLAWWTLTLKLPRKLQERQAAIRAYQAEAEAARREVAPPPAEPQLEHPSQPRAVPSAAPAVTPAPHRQDTGAPRLVYISGEPETPGHLYRVVRPAAAAASLGAITSVMRVDEIPARLDEIAASDALVIWRASWNERIEAAVEAARRGGAKVVFDVDDLMFAPELAKFEVIDGIRTQNLTEEQVRGHYADVRATMTRADLCLATTEELAQRMREAHLPAFVLPNGVDHATITASSLAARRRRTEAAADGLFRIGYAGGSRTHQRDFAVCADAVAEVLRARPECRLVLFRSADGTVPVIDIEEFPALGGLEDQIEWRNFVPLERLPDEMARFDVNLAPLEVGNPFCEAKSELKLFEAALVDVPTIASPTGPYRRAIRSGETGYLAATPRAWKDALAQLVEDPMLRRRIAHAAKREALWQFGPERRVETMASLLDLLRGGRRGARAFELTTCRRDERLVEPTLSEYEVVFEADRLGLAEVTVVVPLYNYAGHVEEALDSVRAQTLTALDLVIVEDRSTDASLDVALRWARANAPRFNRLLVLRNCTNVGLSRTRNTGFDVAETPFVLPLDADNRLLPECAVRCLRTLQETGAAFAYPVIRIFGARQDLIGTQDYDPHRLLFGNYIDAMALIAKAAWVAAGGYNRRLNGWEDFAFWCQLAERGLWGARVPGEPLAEYRVHDNSMTNIAASSPVEMRRWIDSVTTAHPWLRIAWPLPEPEPQPTADPAGSAACHDRLARLLPLLRCPETGQPLTLAPEGDALLSEDGARRWPLVLGRPLLFPGMRAPAINADAHLSNPLPASALAMIGATTGPILHLSAGGTAERFEHVIEAEAAVFQHTDVVADVHHLPFADQAFDAVIALNAFEHYRDPRAAAREILRVLRPGGRVLIRTAFLQPLHEAPWHFYNCTRYGLEAWFDAFETEKLHVSENFHPGHSLAWLASECETALRARLSAADADAFLAAPMDRLVSLWRMPEGARGEEPLWNRFAALPQDAQEVTAAGFEYLGRRPED